MPSLMAIMRTPASRRFSSSSNPKLLRREKREKSLIIRICDSPENNLGRIINKIGCLKKYPIFS